MQFRSLALAATALVSLAACNKKQDTNVSSSSDVQHVAAAAVPPPAGKAWTDVVSLTPEGGVQMGNPDAPVKIVEYASFSCPHCKKFEEEGGDAIQAKYVSTGKVSYEFRSFLIHPMDAPMTLLMYCRGPEPFFALAKQLYAGQDAFMAPIIALKPEELQAIQTQTPQQQFQKYIDVMGLYPWFAARGLPRAQADKCLTDSKASEALSANQTTAETKYSVNSTPSFFINGALWNPPAETSPLWAQLDTQLTKMLN